MYSIRTFLCKSLITNSISSQPQIFKLTVDLVETLVTNFKATLKAEIGVFFNMMFLRVLESSKFTTDTFIQKMKVLDAIGHLAEKPQNLVELYLNYDCDDDSESLLEKLTTALSKARTRPLTLSQISSACNLGP